MHFIQTSKLTVSSPDGPLLTDLSLRLKGLTGITGLNGSGKSTLLRALAADPRVRRTGTTLLIDGSRRSETALEYLRRKAGEAGLEPPDPEAFLEKAGFLPEQNTAHLSGGEYTRLTLECAFYLEPDLLLLDEPTNHLDERMRAWFYARLKGRSMAVIATHDRTLLAMLDPILEVRPPEVLVYGGSYDFYRARKAVETAALEADLRNLRREQKRRHEERERVREREEKRAKQGKIRAARGGAPRVLLGKMKRDAESSRGRLKTIHDRRAGQAQEEYARAAALLRSRRTVRIESSASTADRRAVFLRECNVMFGPAMLWKHPLTLSVRTTDRLWIRGANGSGKSILCSILAALRMPDTGSIERTARIAFLPQGLDAVVLDGVCLPPVRWKNRGEMSAGERMHRLLRQAFDAGPDLLVLDEPSNHLDLDRTIALAESLKAWRAGCVIVTHDANFAAEAGLTSEVTLATGLDRSEGCVGFQ